MITSLENINCFNLCKLLGERKAKANTHTHFYVCVRTYTHACILIRATACLSLREHFLIKFLKTKDFQL